ncbi:MAG: DNA polymerase III subunit gamma/tau [Planctomycetes bacterium]|nr:DNA polymerase III subunit gamma/tau [Planctomycetota bacterium]
MTDDPSSLPGDTTSPANGDYVVVARRYRPQTFEELIGQQHVSQALSRAIASERVGHAYLFTGARGVGKTSAARILAKALNCAQGTSPTPCNQCEICESVSAGGDVDVLEIDGASNRGIDEIRQLRQNVAVRPSRSRFKIYIIDEVHMLTKEAFNALLKTLEEPPEHVKFIFATTEPNKIPVTILSRCQRYDFAGIETAAIQTRLAEIAKSEGVEIEADALQILAMRAAGSMRDSQSLLEQLLSTGCEKITSTDVTTMLGVAPAARLSQLVLPLVARDAATALVELDAAIAEGAEISQLLDQLLGYFRDVMTQSVGCDETSMLYALPGQKQEIRNIANQLGVQTLLAIVQILDQTAARMRVSTHTRTLAEMALVRVCHLDNLDELASLIGELKGTTPPPSAPEKKNLAVRPSAPTSPPQVNAPPPTSTPTQTTTPAAPAPSPPPASEAPPAANEATPSTTALSTSSVEEVWKQVVKSLTGMIADHAAEAEKVSVDSAGRLVLSFSQSFHRDICEKPNNRSRLEAALRTTCGQTAPIVFNTHTRTDAAQPRITSRQARRQQQAEVAAQPFVRKAMELFAGDPDRLRYVPPENES